MSHDIIYASSRDLTAGEWNELYQNVKKERDAYRLLAIELAKELAIKCGDDVHRRQVADLEGVDPKWMVIPGNVCTSSIPSCKKQ